jgi:hypothetical protein
LAGALGAILCALPARAAPPPPAEPVALAELPLPPLAGPDCAAPVSTGCLEPGANEMELGGFLPGGKALLLRMRFAIAPANGLPGDHLVLVRTDGTAFPGGNAWKCLTCGLSPSVAAAFGTRLDHPQPFPDGRRVLAGMTVFDCSPWPLDDERCAAGMLRAYPIETAWAQDPDVQLQGVRLHPDGAHVGFAVAAGGHRAAPFVWVASLFGDGRHYVLDKPQLLYRSDPAARMVRPGRTSGTLEIDRTAIEIEALSGFSADGREIYYRGFPWESGSADLFAVTVATGKVRRITQAGGMVGPVAASPDGAWLALGDAGASGRRAFLAGLRTVPPLTDLVSRAALATLDKADASFLDLVMRDREGDRAGHAGQVLSGSNTGWSVAGAPAWSPDGTAIAAVQVAARPGPATQGRTMRLVLTRLTGRTPARPVRPEGLPDIIGWATPVAPSAMPADRYPIPAGRYRIVGKGGGEALVVLSRSSGSTAITGVSVVYDKFAENPGPRLNGEESAAMSAAGVVALRANLAQAGPVPARKLTGPDGLVLSDGSIAGMMTTTLGAQTWRQPDPGL